MDKSMQTMTRVAEKPQTITRKYVVLRDISNNHFIVGCIITDRYHVDIFGERPSEVFGDEWVIHSAGYYTWDYGQPDTIKVHGKSIGFNRGPRHDDVQLLQQYLHFNPHSEEYMRNENGEVVPV